MVRTRRNASPGIGVVQDMVGEDRGEEGSIT